MFSPETENNQKADLSPQRPEQRSKQRVQNLKKPDRLNV